MNLLNVILSVCITSIMSYFTILNISNQKRNKKVFIIYLLIFIPLIILNCIFFEGITKLFLTIIITTLILYLTIFKKDISNSIYYTLAYELLAYISEIVISLIFVLIFKINMVSYERFQFSFLLFTICNVLLVYFVSKLKFISKNIIG